MRSHQNVQYMSLKSSRYLNIEHFPVSAHKLQLTVQQVLSYHHKHFFDQARPTLGYNPPIKCSQEGNASRHLLPKIVLAPEIPVVKNTLFQKLGCFYICLLFNIRIKGADGELQNS